MSNKIVKNRRIKIKVKITNSSSQIKPKLCTYFLQSLQQQPLGSHVFIFLLNSGNDSAFFISFGTNARDYLPLFTDLIFGTINS